MFNDLESIDWEIISNEKNDDDSEDDGEEGGVCYDFEVKKSQKQKEDLEIFPRFKVSQSFYILMDHQLKKLIPAFVRLNSR